MKKSIPVDMNYNQKPVLTLQTFLLNQNLMENFDEPMKDLVLYMKYKLTSTTLHNPRFCAKSMARKFYCARFFIRSRTSVIHQSYSSQTETETSE